MAIIGHYLCNMRNIWKTGPDSWTITVEQNVQFQVGIYHEKVSLIKFKMADLRPLSNEKFLRYRDSLNIFYVSLQNVYHISISLISRTSSKLGKIRTETRSWRLSAIIFLICVISGKPGQTITIEQNAQFQVGINNFNLIKFKMADLRPLPIEKNSH